MYDLKIKTSKVIDSKTYYEYLLKINQIDGKKVHPNLANFEKTEGFRLPTEVEWEWFSKGGEIAIQDGTFSDYDYLESNIIKDIAWYVTNSENQTHDVGTKKPNQLGLYDCIGNVWEFCGLKMDRKIVRGGSWRNNERLLEIGRFEYAINSIYNHIGFRIVRTI